MWFEARNINAQCAGCNTYRGGNLPQYAIYLEEKYGAGILQELNRLWLTPRKWTREEIEEKRRRFEEASTSMSLGMPTYTFREMPHEELVNISN